MKSTYYLTLVKKYPDLLQTEKDRTDWKRLIDYWKQLQKENDDALASSCIDVKSIVIAIGALLVAFGLGASIVAWMAVQVQYP